MFPFIGLCLNNGSPFNPGVREGLQIFGNFSDPAFYILAFLNGVLLCLPRPKDSRLHLALFVARSILLSYVFYFFLVFLPFLPLSVIALLAIGSGFLMLTPLALFLTCLSGLFRDFEILRKRFSDWRLRGAAVLGFLVLPAAITLSYGWERHVLHKALEYAYSPDFSNEYKLDSKALSRTLAILKNHQRKQNDWNVTAEIPYLSSYYNWLVLDNLTLSNTKIRRLEEIFFGGSSQHARPPFRGSKSVHLIDFQTDKPV